MSAWNEVEGQIIKNNNSNCEVEGDKKFEDNFVTKEFQKLDDSDEYLKILENRLKKIKKNSGILNQLKEKREECINNLLNNPASRIITDEDIELDTEVEGNKIVSLINPESRNFTIGEVVHLINHDHLDQLKQEQEEEEKKDEDNQNKDE